MANVVEGFRDFILRGNVVDLAVGVIVGAAFKSIVDAFVAGIVNPGLGVLVGEPNFDALTAGPIQYGLVVTAAINFLLIALVLYIFLVVPMNRMMEHRAARQAAKEAAENANKAPEVVEPSVEEKLLTEIRDALVAKG